MVLNIKTLVIIYCCGWCWEGAVQNIFSRNKTEFVIGHCSTDGLFALVLSSIISPNDKIWLNKGQERYRKVVGGF